MDTNTVILYVEDHEMSREVMQLLLTNMMGLSNFTMFEASHNFIARVEALSPQPDIIMLDIHVAPHDGFEMLAMLRNNEAYADIPIVALTASVMSEEVQKLIQAGFDAIISKPVDMDSFPRLLERIMNGEEVLLGFE